MKRYRVRLGDEAEDDLERIFRRIQLRSGSVAIARGYVDRITTFIAKLETAAERGTVRDGIRPGLRVIGFERRVSVAFVVDGDEVVVLRLLYAGQSPGS